MSDYVYFTGKFNWVQDARRLNEWQRWDCSCYPDEKSLETMRSLQAEGVKNVIGKDEDGYYFRIGRKNELKIKGVVRSLMPPMLFDGTKPLEGGGYQPLPEGTWVGNGSDGVAKVEVYSHMIPGQKGKRAKALRWESLRIDNLVPFERKDFTEEQQKAMDGLDKVPKQLW